MITVVLTYRNRDLKLVENCINSLKNQTNKAFRVVLVDYGSDTDYKNRLSSLVKSYSFIQLLRCETSKQLWCKSRAINIALKTCDTLYFFVGDIDMIYHPEFIDTLHDIKNEDSIYFQVGFLNEFESKKKQSFSDYKINFKSNPEATGMTLYKTEALRAINGYDEFYNGWGSEDTDVHLRLKNAGYSVNFYSHSILMLHQHHSKHYRLKNSLAPFHPNLEKINAEYLNFTEKNNRVKANINYKWGYYNVLDYKDLEKVNRVFELTNSEAEIKAFIANVLLIEKDKVIKLHVKVHKKYKSFKQNIKKILRKKTMTFLEMQIINNMLLETIIYNLRTNAYQFQYDFKVQTICLIIKL